MPSPQTIRDIARARAWIVFLFYAGLVIFLSHQPGDPNSVMPFPHFDKYVHCIEYFVFSIFFQRALNTIQLKEKYFVGIVVIFSAIFSIVDELHQSFIPYRSCDIFDFLADMVGVSIGVLIYRLFRRKTFIVEEKL